MKKVQKFSGVDQLRKHTSRWKIKNKRSTNDLNRVSRDKFDEINEGTGVNDG